MLTTAKSIQLLDASGMNISPITDITSLYYEVVNSKDTKIISRKYVYDAFPVGVNINPTAEVSIGTHVGISERHPGDNSLYDNGQLYKIVDASNKDILVSRVDTDIIPGTTLREIKVTNYNLSEILSYYTPLDLMDASCHALDISINNINSSINDISTRISNLRESLDAINATLSEIIGWITNNALIPNKFYLINDYYVGDNGCMVLPNIEDFSGPDSGNSLSLLVKANDATTLDGKLYEMYNNSGNALKVYGTYKLEGGKVRITYMKDQYGNEAPYDFYNLTYKYNSEFLHTFSRIYADTSTSVKNNIIKTDPFINHHIPIFNITVDSGNYLLASDYMLKILNNYIGPNNNICIYSVDASIEFANNIIGSSNYIEFTKLDDGVSVCITNTNIQNNNTFKSIHSDSNNKVYNNINIGNNNIILLCPEEDHSYHINNLIINSSNNITLYNNASNVTILNNCDGSINLSDNIIVDNYISSNALPTFSNSVYLFGQDVYAKSFNTLK